MLIILNFEMNREFIAANLCEKKEEVNNCCKGSCHLNKQLEQESKKEESPASNSAKDKFETQLFCQTFASLFVKDNNFQTVNSVYQTPDGFMPVSAIFHPPKA